MIAVGRPRRERHGGEHMVVADVDGTPLWFSSADVALRPAVEAYGSALLLAALDAGGPLRLAGRADLAWRRGTTAVAGLVADWWGYPAAGPQVRAAPRRRRPRAATALCFSGGVDSFHSLLTGPSDALVYVLGYDVALGDEARAAAVEHLVRDVAARTGRDAVIVRTNLREHPSFGVGWERAHGGALAGVGHLLDDHVGLLRLSATFSQMEIRPWGSHPALDPLWSSARLRIDHAGLEIRRIHKLTRIAGVPLVRQHLRVCWENRGAGLNCSHCDKCLITMAVLAHSGQLAGIATLDGPETIVERLEALPSTRYLHSYGTLLEGDLPADLHAAIERLLARTAATTGVMMP